MLHTQAYDGGARAEERARLRVAQRNLVRELGVLAETWEPSGLSSLACHALLAVEAQGRLNVGQLAELLVIEVPTASRTVKALLEAGHLTSAPAPGDDARTRFVRLSDSGRDAVARIHTRADAQLATVFEAQDAAVLGKVREGLECYARLLYRHRLRAAFSLGPLMPEESLPMAGVVRSVLEELHATGPGTAYHDAELRDLYAAYSGKRQRFFVWRRGGRVVGGGALAPLKGGHRDTCEVRKLYLLPEARGLGLGRTLLRHLLTEAQALGFARAYVETFERMQVARSLYVAEGFQALAGPEGNGGHVACDYWLARPLAAPFGASAANGALPEPSPESAGETKDL